MHIAESIRKNTPGFGQWPGEIAARGQSGRSIGRCVWFDPLLYNVLRRTYSQRAAGLEVSGSAAAVPTGSDTQLPCVLGCPCRALTGEHEVCVHLACCWYSMTLSLALEAGFLHLWLAVLSALLRRPAPSVLAKDLVKGERERPVNSAVALPPPRLQKQSVLAEELGLTTDEHGKHPLGVNGPVSMIQNLGPGARQPMLVRAERHWLDPLASRRGG